jgi:hypothetical protein
MIDLLLQVGFILLVLALISMLSCPPVWLIVLVVVFMLR